MWNSLPRPQRLGDAVVERQAAHGLVGELGVHADALGRVESFNEGQRVSDGWQKDVAARFVGLGLNGDPHVVVAFGDVRGHGVDRLGVAVQCFGDRLGGVRLGALAAAPQHEDVGAQLRTEVDGVERLGQSESSHVGIVRGQRALFEDRSREEIDRGHRHLQSGAVQGGAEALE